jgi:hypothetical protein
MGTLQLKRLTTSERMAVTPAVSEPIWDLTLSRLFVGDGVTVGGVPATDTSTLPDIGLLLALS